MFETEACETPVARCMEQPRPFRDRMPVTTCRLSDSATTGIVHDAPGDVLTMQPGGRM